MRCIIGGKKEFCEIRVGGEWRVWRSLFFLSILVEGDWPFCFVVVAKRGVTLRLPVSVKRGAAGYFGSFFLFFFVRRRLRRLALLAFFVSDGVEELHFFRH